MAEDDSAQEKTEDPTEKRKQKARDDGETARSRDLTTFAVLITSAFGFFIFGDKLGAALLGIFSNNFSVQRQTLIDDQLMIAQLVSSFREGLSAAIPFYLCVLIASLVGPTALGGMIFSGKSLMPKLSRMNPISGLKKMFSVNSLVELGKGIAKVSLIIFVAVLLLWAFKEQLLGLSREPLSEAVVHAMSLCLWAAIILSSATVVIALIDVPFQIWQHTKKLRMSKQDIKDEVKDSEGKPEVKARVRQMQMQMAQNRMMAEVPQADVVITNPTHYSVALKYSPKANGAPILIAKGADVIALKIREIAKANDVEFVESPALARSIFYTTDLDQEIPEGLYVAVAQVLAYVFQLRQFRKGLGKRPHYSRNPDIPPELRH